MEKLLNQLIAKWREPFWASCNSVSENNFETITTYVFDTKPMFCIWWVRKYKKVCLRQIMSKESWLWQFVCKSGLITKHKTVHDFMIKHITYSDENFCWWCSMEDPEYYLMICAIKEDYQLWKFLIDNIRIDDDDKKTE